MTQMGHGIPNMIGSKMDRLDQRMEHVMPRYMTLATNGMGNVGAMEMPIPANSLPMRGAPGPFGHIDMGGMFAVLKVRNDRIQRTRSAGTSIRRAASPARPTRQASRPAALMLRKHDCVSSQANARGVAHWSPDQHRFSTRF